MMYRILIAGLLLLSPLAAAGATPSSEDIQAGYLYNFAKNIEWPNEDAIDDFTIAVLGESPAPLMESLSALTREKKVNGHPIRIRTVEEVAELNGEQMVYLGEPTEQLIEAFYKQVKGRPSLLVTFEANNPRWSMIDMYATEDQSIDFVVNKANLLNHQLHPKPELILYRGSEVDVAKLYREGISALELQEKRLQELTEKNAAQQQELLKTEEKNRALEKHIQEQLAQFEAERNQLIEDIYNQTAQLSEQKTQLLTAEEQLALKQQREQIISERIEQSTRRLAEQEDVLQEQTLLIENLGERLGTQKRLVGMYKVVMILSATLFATIVLAYLSKLRTNRTLRLQHQQMTNLSLKLQKQAKDMALHSKYKSEFLANISHELRTPLNSLLILSGSLAENTEGNLTEEQVQSAEVMQSSGKDLLSLINEVLDLSKVEAGQMDIHIKEVSVKSLAQEAQRNFQHVADDKKIDFSTMVTEDAPTLINSDSKRVGQILKNLIANALKFTEKGFVAVTFDAGKLHGKRCLAIEVKDSGTGIAPHKQQMIFEAFQQADGTTARKYGGTGLGLSISRELAWVLGGEIQLESEMEKGSIFRLLLPIDLAIEDEDLPAEEAHDEPSASAGTSVPATEYIKTGSHSKPAAQLKGKTILIADDDMRNLFSLANALAAAGINTIKAQNGEKALKALEENPNIELVLMDIMMPVMDGYETIRSIRKHQRFENLPIIALTAKAMADDRSKCIEAGANDYLPKPVDMNRLLSMMASWMCRQED